MFVQTSAIVQVDVDGLAPPEGTEGHHVFVRVERDAVESGGVTKFGVDRNLVTWDDKPHGALSNQLATERALCYGDKYLCHKTTQFSPVSVFQTYAIPSSLPEKIKFPHGVKVL